MLEQNPNCLASYPRRQLPLHGFFGDQSHRPPSPAFGRITTHHGDDPLPLVLLQHRLCPGPLLVIERPVQTLVLVTSPDLPNRFG